MTDYRSGALVVQWASAIPGREKKLLEVLRKVLDFGERLRLKGRVDDVQIFVTKAGPFRETFMLFGRLQELTSIVVETEFDSLVAEGTLVVRDINIALWEGGKPAWLSHSANPYIEALQTTGLI